MGRAESAGVVAVNILAAIPAEITAEHIVAAVAFHGNIALFAAAASTLGCFTVGAVLFAVVVSAAAGALHATVNEAVAVAQDEALTFSTTEALSVVGAAIAVPAVKAGVIAYIVAIAGTAHIAAHNVSAAITLNHAVTVGTADAGSGVFKEGT